MLLTLLLALAAQQLLPPGSVLQRRDWLLRLEAFTAGRIPDAWLRLTVFLALLALAGALVLQELRAWAFALPALLANVLMLIWSLGDEDYHTAVERADAGSAAASVTQELWVPPDSASVPAGPSQAAQDSPSAGHGQPDEEASASSGRTHGADARPAETAIVYGGYGRWFAPLFFFALAGPLGAAGYRAVVVLARAGRGSEYRVVLAWLDWAPARLLALTFALTGDFVAAIQQLRARGLLDGRPAAAVLTDAAEAAGGSAIGARVLANLLRRSAGVWLAAICVVLLF